MQKLQFGFDHPLIVLSRFFSLVFALRCWCIFIDNVYLKSSWPSKVPQWARMPIMFFEFAVFGFIWMQGQMIPFWTFMMYPWMWILMYCFLATRRLSSAHELYACCSIAIISLLCSAWIQFGQIPVWSYSLPLTVPVFVIPAYAFLRNDLR